MPEIAQVLASGRVQQEKSQLEDLSPREFEILRMILEARTTDEIATAFHVSRKTVANYHYNIKSKLGVSSDIELLGGTFAESHAMARAHCTPPKAA